MDSTKKNMWQFPWRYRESIAITIGIFLVGMMLQLSLGSFNFYLLHAPYNIVLGAFIILLTIGLSFVKNSFVTWLASVPLSVTLIGSLLLMTILMGLIPQYSRVNTNLHLHLDQATAGDVVNYIFVRLGLKQVTTSWPFVLLYNFTLFVLGLVTARRLHNFKKSDYAFYLNHLGLWLFLFAAGYGSADLYRYVMYVNKGDVEWRVRSDNDDILELDIAIKLHNFKMEEYPPKLAILENKTGDVLPLGRPQYFQIDEKVKQTNIAGWDVQIKDYIHEAVRKTDTTFQAIPMTGSMPAIELSVTNTKTNKTVEGWVTCGSIDQFVMPLELDSLHSLVMTTPEPKRFTSEITVITKDSTEEPIHAIVEVNKPLKVGSWMIYQYDYDKEFGKASQRSGFELVYDPWLNIVYAGIIMLALGAVCMLWVGNKKKKV